MREKTFFNLLIVIFCLSLIFSMASITRAGVTTGNGAGNGNGNGDGNGAGNGAGNGTGNGAGNGTGNGAGTGNGIENLITIRNPLTEGTQFEDIVDNLVDFVFNIAIVLAPLTTIIAGFLLATAGGNLEQINKAKTMIVWSIVGFLIILLAKGIMAVIVNLLGVS